MGEQFIAPLYKLDDERIEIDLPPIVYETWSADTGSAEGPTSENEQWARIIRRVMDIQFEGGKSAFARILLWRVDSAVGPWRRAKLFAELGILRWLEANASSLPVPRILAFDDVNCLLCSTVMPGMNVFHSYPHLSTAAKEHSVISWAHISVSMFHISTPQRFGTVENSLHLYTTPQHTFDTGNTADILSFFRSAISARRTRSLMINNTEEHEMLCSRLDRLLEGVKPLVAQAQDTPSMSRFVLTHRDLHSANILLDQTSGKVVGIVDWEFHACMPACMSVDYPSWIYGSVDESTLYRNPESKFETFCFEPRAERDRLCDLYEQTVKELDGDYHHCLLAGTRLRDALKWIEIEYLQDDDGVRMARWTEDHLFPAGAVKL
ncbi:hypothetical protein B0H19DRAFT_1259424 [Mycena capillaripes]|nr:hypothetical protein B0H19DRAFT_1259424 [Mycena capillaripes]